MSVQFINSLGASHEHGGVVHSHDHGGDHGHTHEHLDHPGICSPSSPRHVLHNPPQANSPSVIFQITLLETFKSGVSRSGSVGTWFMLLWRHSASRPFSSRPVGSGKTALTLALCKRLRGTYNIGERALANLVASSLFRLPVATVTNDIFTREDQEFLIKNEALPPSRILAIETGGCPHAAIREDISANLGALETLQVKYGCQLLFVESGGDNLAANYSRELADYIIYVIDVAVCPFFLLGNSRLPDHVAGRGQNSTQGWTGYLPV